MREDWGDYVREGWKPLLRGLQERAEGQEIKIDQVKEKFGSLRFYYRGGDDAFAEAVDAAERASAHICEECGKPGSRHSVRGWLRTVCSEHQ